MNKILKLTRSIYFPTGGKRNKIVGYKNQNLTIYLL